MSKHTPTPWESVKDGKDYAIVVSEGDSHKDFASDVAVLYSFKGSPAKENAKHIVKCVNEHEALNRSVIEYAYYISELHDQEKALKHQVKELVEAAKPYVDYHADDIKYGLNDFGDLKLLAEILANHTTKEGE